ncbi:DUF1189 family protein [Ureibacillus sp. NPDC094379]
MVKHSQLFIDSLIHPKKLAAYRLLTIGKILQYIFLLVSMVTIFSFSQFVLGVSQEQSNFKGLTEYVKNIQWLLYPFALILQFLVSTFVLFIQISIYALASLVILKIMNRRGEYRHIWRTSALAITWATLLTILFSFIPISQILASLIGIAITLTLLTLAISKYPKKLKK